MMVNFNVFIKESFFLLITFFSTEAYSIFYFIFFPFFSGFFSLLKGTFSQ